MKKKIIIEGESLHDIGYRYFLTEAALNFGIERFRAVNVLREMQEVHAFAEGEEDQLSEYVEFVSTNFPRDALVRRVTHEDYRGYIPKIESFALVFNMGQTLKFIDIGKSIDKKLETSLEKQDSMLEKQDSMLEKQDSMLEKQDSMLEKQDSTIGEIKATRKELTREIRAVGEKVDSAGKKVGTVSEKMDMLHGEQKRTNEILDEKFNRMQK